MASSVHTFDGQFQESVLGLSSMRKSCQQYNNQKLIVLRCQAGLCCAMCFALVIGLEYDGNDLKNAMYEKKRILTLHQQYWMVGQLRKIAKQSCSICIYWFSHIIKRQQGAPFHKVPWCGLGVILLCARRWNKILAKCFRIPFHYRKKDE